MCGAIAHVRFTPNSDRETRHAQIVMSALPPKADMCGANALVLMAHYDAERIVWRIVDVDGESNLIDIEAQRSLDIAHRQRDHFD